jgi:hypothetical protein
VDKLAQIDSNPSYVAEQLFNIILVMMSRMPQENMRDSYSSVLNKINDINILEVSNKKSVGGAPIGVSISLVKNMLNGKDPYFIRLVLDDLTKRLTLY